MKKRIFILVCWLCSLCLACDGYLDTYPSNARKPGEEISNEADVEALLHGAYRGLVASGYYGADFIIYGEVKGDDMQARVAGQRTEAAYRFSWQQSDAPEGLWQIPYEVISRANFLLESISGQPENDFLKDAKGQALTLRALCHFNLLQIYGYPYLKDGGKSWGVPLADRVMESDAVPARRTVREGYEMVVDDLRKAMTGMKAEVRPAYLNQWGAKALLAKVYLYQGNWDSAYVYAHEIIASGPYSLIPHDQYVGAWSKEFTTESIFQPAISEQSATNKELLGYVAAPGGYSSLIATQDFKDLMDEDPQDVRQGLLQKKSRYWFINKYPGRNGHLAVNNVPVLRLSDIYLMAAEAALKKKQPEPDRAADYLNAIRLRANPALKRIPATEEEILKERRKELVMEGHRFFDAMRLGKRITRQGGFHFLSAKDLISPSWEDYRIVAPIPQTEIDVNPNLRGQQNEGY